MIEVHGRRGGYGRKAFLQATQAAVSNGGSAVREFPAPHVRWRFLCGPKVSLVLRGD
jgi:hypothetical protein